jgi:hypothetical protein
MGQISGNLPHRYADRESIFGFLRHRYSDVFIQGFLKHRYADKGFISGTRQHRYRDLSQAFVNAIGTQIPLSTGSFGITPPPNPPGRNTFPPGVYYTFGLSSIIEQASTGNFLSLNSSGSGNIERFSYTIKKNAGVEFEMELLFNYGELTQAQIQSIQTLTDPASFAGDQNIDITINSTIQVADQSVTLCPLVILQRDYEDAPEGWKVTLRGTDWLTRMLNKRNLNLDSYVSGINGPGFAASIWMATQILNNFLPQFGITSIIYTSFSDYPIRSLHIQNTRPMDILNQILWVPRAYWYPDGRNLRIQEWQVVASPNWVYQDQPNAVMLFSEQSQSSDLINRVKVNLTVPAYIKGTTFTANQWGGYSITLNPPLRRPLAQIDSEQNGQLLSYDYFDTNGNWVAHFPMESDVRIPPTVGNGGFIGNTQMIGSVQIVWAPPMNSQNPTAEGTGWLVAAQTTFLQITFRGADPLGPSFENFIPPTTGPFTQPSTITAFSAVFMNGVAVTQIPTGTQGVGADMQYSIVVQDSNSIAMYGLQEAEFPVENALIPNLAWAWQVGVNTLEESGRLKNTYKLQVPMNPLMNIGDTVQVIDSSAYLNVTGIIEEVQFEAISETGVTNFTMVVYPNT